MIRVLIVDDTRLYREGLAHILGREDDISVVGDREMSPGFSEGERRS